MEGKRHLRLFVSPYQSCLSVEDQWSLPPWAPPSPRRQLQLEETLAHVRAASDVKAGF